MSYHSHFFSSSLSERFGPSYFPRITLALKTLVTFRTTELKRLRVIPYKGYSMAGINWRAAEIAHSNSHVKSSFLK